MRRFIRIGLFLLAAILLVLAAGILAASRVPKFYSRALSVEPGEARENGERLEEKFLKLHNDAVREELWEATFSAAELNGWLAEHLAKRYPRLAPSQISSPRIQLRSDRVRLAFRVDSGWLRGVVVLELEPFLVPEQRHLAVRLVGCSLGWFPLPTKRVVAVLSQAATSSNIPLAWGQDLGSPVAYLPSRWAMEKSVQRIMLLDAIKIGEGEIVVQGRAVDQ